MGCSESKDSELHAPIEASPQTKASSSRHKSPKHHRKYHRVVPLITASLPADRITATYESSSKPTKPLKNNAALVVGQASFPADKTQEDERSPTQAKAAPHSLPSQIKATNEHKPFEINDHPASQAASQLHFTHMNVAALIEKEREESTSIELSYSIKALPESPDRNRARTPQRVHFKDPYQSFQEDTIPTTLHYLNIFRFESKSEQLQGVSVLQPPPPPLSSENHSNCLAETLLIPPYSTGRLSQAPDFLDRIGSQTQREFAFSFNNCCSLKFNQPDQGVLSRQSQAGETTSSCNEHQQKAIGKQQLLRTSSMSALRYSEEPASATKLPPGCFSKFRDSQFKVSEKEKVSVDNQKQQQEEEQDEQEKEHARQIEQKDQYCYKNSSFADEGISNEQPPFESFVQQEDGEQTIISEEIRDIINGYLSDISEKALQQLTEFIQPQHQPKKKEKKKEKEKKAISKLMMKQQTLTIDEEAELSSEHSSSTSIT